MPSTPPPPTNVPVVQDHDSSLSTMSSSNFNNQQQQHNSHHPSSTYINSNTLFRSCPMNCINNLNQQQPPNTTIPQFTHNHHQHPLHVNIAQQNHQLTTSGHPHPPFVNLNHQQLISQYPQNQVIPMENDIDNQFTVVNRKKNKKKKQKIDIAPPPASLSSSSCSSTPTTNSTSSTNTSSIITNAQPGYTNHTQLKTSQDIVADPEQTTTEISTQARRFAETRYPFPPFIVKFNNDIDEKTVINAIGNHYLSKYNVKLLFAGHRLKFKRELLLFVNNRESFEILFDDLKWPFTIDTLYYEKTLPNRLPPQFSVVLRNVPMNIDCNELLSDIKNNYGDVIGAHRMLNKDKQMTTFIRLDINNSKVIDELLGRRFIYVNNSRFSVTEYLAPAKVLLCAKCFSIGHFRNSCKNKLDHCKTCGRGVEDLNLHKHSCDKKSCCVRCKGPHDSNDMRCPVIRSYRSVLTKSLLNPVGTSNNQQVNKSNYPHTDQDFPVLNINHTTSQFIRNNDAHNRQGKSWGDQVYNNVNIGYTSERIDDLFIKMKKINDNVDRLVELNNNYVEQLTRANQVISRHEHVLQLQQLDIGFQHDFISQFISPICQMVVDIIPALIKQKVIDDKSLLCPSLSELSGKLINESSVWTNRFLKNENLKLQLIKNLNVNNPQPLNEVGNSNDPPLSTST